MNLGCFWGGVLLLVGLKTQFTRKRRVTDVAAVRFLSCMHSFMDLQVTRLSESLVTMLSIYEVFLPYESFDAFLSHFA